MIKLIAAYDDNNGIGKDGKIPWNVPEDLEWFKHLTTGHVVLMGYKTWQSLGNKALPNRENIVLTKNSYSSLFYAAPDIHVVDDFEAALWTYKKIANPGKDLWIIGGAQVYQKALDLDLVDEMYLAHIHGDYNCDVKLPKLSLKGLDILSYCRTNKYTQFRYSYTRV